MIHNETNLVVADNSGAKSVRVIRLFGGGSRRFSSVGDIVLCSVKTAIPNSKVRKGQIVKGIIVRTKFPINRPDGSTIAFDDNAIVLLSEEGGPIGTRVFGPIARELRDKGEGYMKIVSLAPEVL
ncbi:MAG: 50S ribosomal protein L14 [Bacilli bacterium]|jgi:large subunit ribosomal protein L14|nr:50S ribosomal protein L14 [Bacilli bacterium]NLN80840.1 50S ribosomal protein L14 [Erysipelotrichia bacterium]